MAYSLADYPVIWLVGMPASGKSTFGRKLAAHLGYGFADTDILIEKQQGHSVPVIFERKGEAFFRELERAIIPQVHHKKPVVSATGGGLPCFHQNMETLLATGLVVYLQVPISELVDRVLRQNGTRPLLPQQDKATLEKAIQGKYDSRAQVYEKAHITLTFPEISVKELWKQLH